MALTPKPKPKDLARLADPNSSIGYLSRITFRSFSRAMERRSLPFGVSGGQWRFLRQLWVEDGLTQRELSRRVGMREPTTVTAVNSLVRSGFVERVPSLKDRRKIHIHLTERAKALQAELLPCVAEVNALATQGVDPADLNVFIRVLNQINANLADEADEPLVYGDESP
ncbi:MAG: MarR family transcriptional regulator [Caulobacteraceae bacterium]|nr:MarR family transcriptional regulator [Caulobacteraceae bacterium]